MSADDSEPSQWEPIGAPVFIGPISSEQQSAASRLWVNMSVNVKFIDKLKPRLVEEDDEWR